MPFLTTGKDITEKRGAGRVEGKRENKPTQNFSENNINKIMITIDMRLLTSERDEAREKAERYRLEANAMMAKLHELETYADRLADGLPTGMLPRDVENLREANAGLADDLQKAQQERDEARTQYRSTLALAEALAKTQIELKAERDAAREKLSHAQALLAEMQDALKLAVKQLLGKKDV